MRPNRVEMDEADVRTAVNIVARSHERVVIDVEEPAWALDAEGADERWTKLLAWCRAEAPHLKVGLYNVPHVTQARNIDARNEWCARWAMGLADLARKPWFNGVDFCCPDLYPESEYQSGGVMVLPTFADWQRRATAGLWMVERVTGLPVVPVARMEYPDGAPCPWMPDALAWLDGMGFDVALWEGPEPKEP
jgi:hypothetical protein